LEKTLTNSKLFKNGFNDGIAIGIGYIPLAMALAIKGVKSGITFGLWELMCALLFSGSGQSAALNLIAGGETVIFTYALTFFIVNCRYILLSLSMAQKFDPKINFFSRMIFAIFNTDEIFTVAMQQKGLLQTPYLFGLSVVPYLGWMAGITTGFIFTNLLPPSVSSAFGVTIYAMFLALIVPPMRTSKAISIVVLCSAVISALLECNPFVRQFLSPGWIMIICAVVTSTIGALIFPIGSEKENSSEGVNNE